MSTWTNPHSLLVSGTPEGLRLAVCFRAGPGSPFPLLAGLRWRIDTANGPVALRTARVTALSHQAAVAVLVCDRRRDRLRLAAACRLAGGAPFRIDALEAAGSNGTIRFVPSPACGWIRDAELLFEAERVAA